MQMHSTLSRFNNSLNIHNLQRLTINLFLIIQFLKLILVSIINQAQIILQNISKTVCVCVQFCHNMMCLHHIVLTIMSNCLSIQFNILCS